MPRATSSSRARLAWAVAAFLAVATALALRAWSLRDVPGHPDPAAWGMQDYRDAAHYPARSYAEGHNPYDVADHLARYPVRQLFPLYSPLFLALHVPFGLLAHRAGQVAYFLTQLAAMLALAAVALRAAGRRPSAAAVFGLGAALLASRPGHMGQVLGQATPVFALLTIACLDRARARPWLAGAALALATAKPTYGAPLFLLLLALGERRAAWRGLLLGTALTFAAAVPLVRAAGGVEALLATFQANHAHHVQMEGAMPLTSYARLDLYTTVCRLLGVELPGTAELLFALGTLAGTMLLLARVPRDDSDPAWRDVGVTLALLGLLLAVYHQAYDALVCVAPLVALATPGRGLPGGAPRWMRGACLALLSVPMANYLATSTGLAALHLQPGDPPWTVVATLSPAALCLVFALQASLVLRARA